MTMLEPVQFQSLPFWDISLGNILVIVGIAIQGLLLFHKSSKMHGENQEKIKEFIEWRRDHEADAKQRDQQITELRIIAAGMEAAAVAMQKNVEIMQRQLEELIRRNR